MKNIFTCKEVAEMLGFSRQWISKQCKFGNIKSDQVGKEYLIRKNEAEKWLRKIREGQDRHLLFPRCSRKD
jgi:excisionase family DNA binding protein